MADRLTWIGHATVVIELNGARLITDPVLRGRLLHLRRRATAPADQDVARLDAILLSHLHLDHLDVPSLRRLPRDLPVLGPRGAGRVLRRAGFRAVTELRPGDRLGVGGLDVTAVPAVHDGRRHPLGAAGEALGFVVAGGRRRVYFAGDTDVFEGMADIAGRLDVALLPVWGWGPTLGPGHMDPRAAATATAMLRPRLVVPIHWGTLFPIGLARVRGGPLVEPPREFARHVTELAPSVAVRILEPGETLALE